MNAKKDAEKVELWSLHYTVSSLKLNSPPRTIVGYVDFYAKDDEDAKRKILGILKSKMARVKWTKDRLLLVMASPCLEADNPDKGYDGNRMIRNKHSYSGKRILRIKNPELALVQGYGAEAWDKLCS